MCSRASPAASSTKSKASIAWCMISRLNHPRRLSGSKRRKTKDQRQRTNSQGPTPKSQGQRAKDQSAINNHQSTSRQQPTTSNQQPVHAFRVTSNEYRRHPPQQLAHHLALLAVVGAHAAPVYCFYACFPHRRRLWRRSRNPPRPSPRPAAAVVGTITAYPGLGLAHESRWGGGSIGRDQCHELDASGGFHPGCGAGDGKRV